MPYSEEDRGDGMECKLSSLVALAETYVGAEPRQDLKHFVVRRLESACLGVLSTVPLCERERFKQVITSLAIPISMIVPESQEGAGKAVSDFVLSISRLSRLTAGDLHLDIIKHDSALGFQRAVNDIDPCSESCNRNCADHTGHRALSPSTAVQAAPFRKVFVGFLLKLISRHIARAQNGNVAARRFCASYLLSKRGWPQLCDEKLEATVGDHQKYLSAVPAQVSEELLQEIRTTCENVFRKTTLTKMSPSLHASRDSSRKNLGAFGEVMVLAPNIILPLRPTEGGRLFLQHPSLRRERHGVSLLVDTPTQRIPLVSLRSQSEVIEGGRISAREYHQAISSWKYQLFVKLEVDMNTFSDERKSVRAQVIPEPGKFRMITAGDGLDRKSVV